MTISILILTFNEERNLPSCLNSLKWCNDIVILDSYSSDKTVDIALEYNTRVIKREFDDYAKQRNFGLKNISYKSPWIFMVDADEVVPPSLADEIIYKTNKASPSTSLFYLRRKDYFMGKWIRHSSGYPTWFGRLARVGQIHVTRSINEEFQTDGQIAFLKEHLLHYPFNKGLNEWITKHNRYSKMEADLITLSNKSSFQVKNLFNKNPIIRRRQLKQIVYSLPFRPIIIFCLFYFFRLGFLDGKAGFHFCMLKTFYEYLISCKVIENNFYNKGITF